MLVANRNSDDSSSGSDTEDESASLGPIASDQACITDFFAQLELHKEYQAEKQTAKTKKRGRDSPASPGPRPSKGKKVTSRGSGTSAGDPVRLEQDSEQ